EGLLRVRNRIYDRVFDREWVRTHMPDAELRRQRAAYRRGVVRAAGIGGIILLAMSLLTGFALRESRRANRTANTLRKNLYVSDMNLAYEAWYAGNPTRAGALLEKHRPKPA